jgi:hypothetical protein
MQDRKAPDGAVPSAEPATPTSAKPGGFGAFADVYRARWAANHPNMPHRAESDTLSPPLPETVDVRPFAEDGTRLIRPGGHK